MPAACTGPCFVGTFGTCGSLLGRVFSETTVICTELFRQGLLDLDTFLADAEFGRRMATDSPKTLLVDDSTDIRYVNSYFSNPKSCVFSVPGVPNPSDTVGRTNERIPKADESGGILCTPMDKTHEVSYWSIRRIQLEWLLDSHVGLQRLLLFRKHSDGF